jgi:hypothetical protein
VKVFSPISSNQVVRGFAVLALVSALAGGIAATPVAAVAEESQPVAAAPAVDASATMSVEATPTAMAVTALVASASIVPAPVTPAKKLTVKQIIAKTGYAAGLSKAEVDAMLWMAKRESNYHPWSESRSECHGLFQLSKGMAHGHPWKDPAWNTKRAIKYMKGRYGGVLKAKAFWLAHHWY